MVALAKDLEFVNGSRWCECGNRKAGGNHACDRCSYLDGNRDVPSRVIAALRDVGGMSLRELCETVHGGSCNTRRRSMLRTVQILERATRIRRYWREIDTVLVTSRRFNRAPITRPSGGAGCWVYALDGRTEDGR